MGKKNRKKEKIVQEKAKFDNPFAALKSEFPDLPDAAEESTQPEPEPEKIVVPYKTMNSARTRIERKHRGGKTVTFVEGIETLSHEERELLVADLKKALGSGGFVEEDAVVLQGDVRERVEKFLAGKR